MKYLSIDTETTGLDPNIDQILSIGIVIEDTNNQISLEDLPKLHLIIVRERMHGNLFSLNMNKNLISLINQWNISDQDKRSDIEKENKSVFCREEDVCSIIFKFLYKNNMLNPLISSGIGDVYPTITSKTPKTQLTIAGKNFATFDKLFLENLPRWRQLFNIRQRIIDPAILFTDFAVDESLPSLSVCKERAGFESEVSHNAVEDAIDIVKLLRIYY